jgi:hypothetical protein
MLERACDSAVARSKQLQERINVYFRSLEVCRHDYYLALEQNHNLKKRSQIELGIMQDEMRQRERDILRHVGTRNYMQRKADEGNAAANFFKKQLDKLEKEFNIPAESRFADGHPQPRANEVNYECCVCMGNRANAIIPSFRCGHIAMCKVCALRMVETDTPTHPIRCPICRSVSAFAHPEVQEVYFPTQEEADMNIYDKAA